MAGLTVAGCVLPYYMQATRGQISMLRQRVPITEVVANSEYDAGTREQLELVLELRRFAIERLELPDNDSYTSYVDLGRDFVVWNVVAAGKFSIDPVTWCFPVAGCVAYRGYFDRARAEAFADRLESRDYDTFVGGSTAYSTLGHFADPVLNTMLQRGPTEIAATLFHELAHQLVYIRSDTEFNESFATAVEQYAVQAWLERGNQTDALARYRAGIGRQREFAELVSRQRERLAEAFSDDTDPDWLLRTKQEAYEQMRREYEVLKSGWGGISDYDGWFDSGLNNARLVALTSYQRWVPGLRARLERLGPEDFYAEARGLAELDRDERTELLEAWNEASVVAGVTDDGKRIDSAAQIGADNRLH
jgi:predicted aminopeptidase